MSSEGDWRRAVDPTTNRVYFFNAVTRETSWTQPGDFLDGAHAPQQLDDEYDRRNVVFLARPARRQQDASQIGRKEKGAYVEGGGELNIWYQRRYGEHWSRGLAHGEAAETRCWVVTDAGCTRADTDAGTGGSAGYWCIHWARGTCINGTNCTFYHRPPTKLEARELDAGRDIFGRARHKEQRSDMGGAGSFMEESRTLYVGGLAGHKYRSGGKNAGDAKARKACKAGGSAASPRLHHHMCNAAATHQLLEAGMDPLEVALWRHFGDWGEIDKINAPSSLKGAVAFVTFTTRAGAELAHVAMDHQALDRGEVLNIRWAHDDPNPAAIAGRRRARQNTLVAAAARRGAVNSDFAKLAAAAKDTGDDIAGLAHKRRRTATSSAGAYPDTMAQFGSGGGSGGSGNGCGPKKAAAIASLTATVAAANTMIGPGRGVPKAEREATNRLDLALNRVDGYRSSGR